jgi:transcriptional regulator with XRE-family HTH domain
MEDIEEIQVPTRTNLQQKFAKFVKEKRNAIGWSQANLAEMVFGHVKYKSYISEIETGVRKSMNIETMDRILEAFGSDIKFLE